MLIVKSGYRRDTPKDIMLSITRKISCKVVRDGDDCTNCNHSEVCICISKNGGIKNGDRPFKYKARCEVTNTDYIFCEDQVIILEELL